MKKNFIGILLIISFTTFGQVSTLSTVADISTFNANNVTILLVTDDIRGGQFNIYSGSDVADAGMIFNDAQSRKWKRVTTNNRINIQWYGARTANADNRNEIISALNYIKNHQSFTTLYIPAENNLSTYYQVSDQISIDHPINILGDGSIGNPLSKLQFARNKNGLIISYADIYGGFSAEIKNLLISGTTSSTPRDISKHGITSRVIIKMENVYVTNIEGNGIHLSACAIQPSGDNNNYGNADGSYLENVTANFCNNGIFLEGCDANTIQIINSSTNENVRWGIYDNGFLGNSFIKPHCAFNGVPGVGNAVGGNSVVTYNGKYYVAKPGFDDYLGDAPGPNVNKQPDLNQNYWQEVSAMTSTVWNNSTRYYSGGPICIRNPNSKTNIFNSYTEDFQPPINLNPRSKADGGFNGAGVTGGSFHSVLYGYDIIANSGTLFPNSSTQQRWLTLGNNAIDYIAPLKVFNDPNISGAIISAFFETTRSSNYIGIKNSTTSGAIGYNFSDFNFYMDGLNTLIGQITPLGIFSGSNNTQTLGSSATRWNNIFSSEGNFSSSIAIGTPASNPNSILDLTSTTKGLLLPRMTKAQRNAISNPTEGLAVYQIDNTPGLRVYNGTNWIKYNETID